MPNPEENCLALVDVNVLLILLYPIEDELQASSESMMFCFLWIQANDTSLPCIFYKRLYGTFNVASLVMLV